MQAHPDVGCEAVKSLESVTVVGERTASMRPGCGSGPVVHRKTRYESYDQWQRVFRLLGERQETRVARAHPATGGNPTLAQNWGNTEARAALDEYWRLLARARRGYESRP